ncbi:hypothetical protein ACFL38_00930 [Candidatus Omnitrophota bacterium]
MGMFLSILGLYLIPTLILSAPIWFFSRKRVQWFPWEYFSFLLALGMWFLLTFIFFNDKSLAHMFEVFIIGVLVGLSQLIRVILPKMRESRIISAVVVMVIQICSTVAVCVLMPAMPE